MTSQIEEGELQSIESLPVGSTTDYSLAGTPVGIVLFSSFAMIVGACLNWFEFNSLILPGTASFVGGWPIIFCAAYLILTLFAFTFKGVAWAPVVTAALSLMTVTMMFYWLVRWQIGLFGLPSREVTLLPGFWTCFVSSLVAFGASLIWCVRVRVRAAAASPTP